MYVPRGQWRRPSTGPAWVTCNVLLAAGLAGNNWRQSQVIGKPQESEPVTIKLSWLSIWLLEQDPSNRHVSLALPTLHIFEKVIAQWVQLDWASFLNSDELSSPMATERAFKTKLLALKVLLTHLTAFYRAQRGLSVDWHIRKLVWPWLLNEFSKYFTARSLMCVGKLIRRTELSTLLLLAWMWAAPHVDCRQAASLQMGTYSRLQC